MLDQILQLYVEENQSARDIIARGFEEKTVRWIQRRVDLNEYKRAQAAPGTQGNEPRIRCRPPDADRAAVCGPRTARKRSLFREKIRLTSCCAWRG